MTYEQLLKTIESLGDITFPAVTPLGYGIPLIRIGKGKPVMLIVSSIHAREHITTHLACSLVKNYKSDTAFDFIPMLNVDGVILATEGLAALNDTALKKQLKLINYGSDDFRMWKANIYGVDLNVNFDADWGEGQSNITYPASENYIGVTPHSEIETKFIADILEKNRYPVVVSYHSKGEVVYWGYEHNYSHYREAKDYADFIGYELTRSEGSCGGLKDYYALNYEGLGLTVEVGEDKYPHPYPMHQLGALIEKHTGSLELLARTGEKIGNRIHEESVGAGKTIL